MAAERRLILRHIDQPGYTPDIDCYRRHGGYKTLEKALRLEAAEGPDGRRLTPQERLRQEVAVSQLRGRGGAGFSTGLKWSLVDRTSGKPIHLICNADESEPGAFKDRQILYKDPHQLLEGMILACYANEVHQAWIYIRGEFIQGARILEKALEEARRAGFLGNNILGSGYDLEIHIHRGAGAYICGEETALIESLEGRRPYPRVKPPFYPTVFGLYQCPTIVNNVETLCAVKHVIEMGGAEYAKLGSPNNTGTRIVCLSGCVRRPGYYEIETGKVTLRELIFEESFGGGLREGRRLKAVIPGGVSSRVFRAGEKVKLPSSDPSEQGAARAVDALDIPYDFTTVAAAGSMSGAGAIIVLDDTVSMVEALANIAEFFAHESCGQCVPCREGSFWISEILRRILRGEGRPQDPDELLRIARNIAGGKTVCAFGDACARPVESFVTKFEEEFRAACGARIGAPAGGE